MAKNFQITLIGTQTSESIDLDGSATVIRIGMPTAWDTSDLFVEEQLGPEGRWRQMFDEFGDALRFPVRANQVFKVDPKLFVHSRAIRFYSGVSQSTSRTLDILTARFSELLIGDFA